MNNQINIDKPYLSKLLYRTINGEITGKELWEFCKLTKFEPTLYKIDSECSMYIHDILKEEDVNSERFKTLLVVLYKQLRR